MPRPLLIRTDTHPYHVTSRCNNKEFFPIPLELVWSIMKKELKKEIEENDLVIHAFVLMGNHFHLLCHTPKANLDQIMQRFLRSTSIKISSRSKTMNHLWGGRYKWTLIDSEIYYYQVYRYIYQNPLRAKVCERVEDYKFSTLIDSELPVQKLTGNSFKNEEYKLAWLNEKYNEEDREVIRLGLRKKQFDVSQRNKNIMKFKNKEDIKLKWRSF